MALEPPSTGVVAAVVATILWAVGSVITKDSLRQFDAVDLVLIELAASNLSLCAVLAFRRWQSFSVCACVRLALPGVLQPGLAYSLAFLGLQWTSVSLETLLWASEGAIMLPFAFYFLRESVSRLTAVLGAVAIAGVVIASASSIFEKSVNANALVGNILILGAVLSACGYTVLVQRDLREHEPLPLLALHQLSGLATVVSFRTLWPRQVEVTGPHPLAAYGEAGLAGVLLFSAPFWLFLQAIKSLGAATASQFLPLVPVLTMLLAGRLLGEHISSFQLAGSVITIAATSALGFVGARSVPAQQTILEHGEKT